MQLPSIRLLTTEEAALGNIIPKDAIYMTMAICISTRTQPEIINQILEIFVRKVLAYPKPSFKGKY